MDTVVLLIKKDGLKMKTKISLVLLGLGLACGSAYAGAVAEPMPVSNDINVTAPDQSGMWSFGGTAVLMQPTNKDFNYADKLVGNFNNPGNSANNVTVKGQTVSQNYHWWFGADIAYAFPGNGRDVTLAYEGLHGSNTDNTSLTSADSGLRSSFSGLDYTGAEGKSDTSYDAGDLVFGQKLDVGQRIRLHPFVGLRMLISIRTIRVIIPVER
jgi:Legionella pneumophila major outer membrane protein precursor